MSVRVYGWWGIHQPHLVRTFPSVGLLPFQLPARRVRFLSIPFGYSPKPRDFSIDYDPFEDFFGLGIDMKTRKQEETVDDSQSTYVEYEKNVPCPVCRGRGYVLDGPKGPISCSCCGGKGMVLEDSVWESAWETAQNRSPLRVVDDESVEKFDQDVANKRPEKRVYGPRPEAVRMRISRTLKELERRTGALSKRAKRQHQNPVVHARMVAAIKTAKNTEAAKLKVSENQKRYFQNPENRKLRGLQMKGVKFSCKQCGKEGHRRHHCPELGFVQKLRPSRKYKCGLCRQEGHTRPTCPRKEKAANEDRDRRKEVVRKGVKRGPYKCGQCQEKGHNRKTCPLRIISNGNP